MLRPQEQHRFAWFIAIFFFAGSVLSYVDRAVLGVVLPQVRKDLALTNTQYSLAINAFLIMYMIFYFVGGQLADRIGSRRAFSLNIIFWSVASVAHAIASGLASLCFLRALLGMGEGGFYPAAMRGTAEWFRPESRAKAVGLLLCGMSIGMLLTPPVAAWITFHYGWRMAFLVTGSLGFLLVPPWLLLHRVINKAYGKADPAPASLTEQDSSASSTSFSIGHILAKRKYWLFLLARAFPDTVTFFYLFWLPGYFQDIRHYDLVRVGKLLWIPFLCADLGALGGTWMSSELIRRGLGLDRSRKLILLLSALCPILGASAFLAPNHILALAFCSLALFGHFSWAANIQTVITEITPPKHVAALYGLTGAVGTLLAALTQPLVGRSVDLMGYAPPFIGTAVVYLIALSLLFSGGEIEPIG